MNARSIWKWTVPLTLGLGFGAAMLFPSSQQVTPAAEEKPATLQAFMRQKLEASSQILEGLTVEDAELIKKGTTKILEMSKVELWNVLTDADYREFNRDFRSSMRKLDQAATEKNFDNAILQWIDAMKGCVECHKYVRSERVKLKSP